MLYHSIFTITSYEVAPYRLAPRPEPLLPVPTEVAGLSGSLQGARLSSGRAPLLSVWACPFAVCGGSCYSVERRKVKKYVKLGDCFFLPADPMMVGDFFDHLVHPRYRPSFNL